MKLNSLYRTLQRFRVKHNSDDLELIAENDTNNDSIFLIQFTDHIMHHNLLLNIFIVLLAQ
jgi:hypothetical protein